MSSMSSLSRSVRFAVTVNISVLTAAACSCEEQFYCDQPLRCDEDAGVRPLSDVPDGMATRSSSDDVQPSDQAELTAAEDATAAPSTAITPREASVPDSDNTEAGATTGHAPLDAGVITESSGPTEPSPFDSGDQSSVDEPIRVDASEDTSSAEDDASASTSSSEGDASGTIEGPADGTCTENSDCPSSACRYLGPQQGLCFDDADVVAVSTTDELESAVASTSNGATRVLKLNSGTYDLPPLAVPQGAEVAIIGADGVVITRSSSGGSTHTLNASSDSILYVSNLTMIGGVGRAIGQASSAQLWVEDVTIGGYEYALDGSGTRFVRRSRLAGTSGVVRHLGGELHIENSSLGPSEGTALQLAMLESELDLSYVTIAGNKLSMSCSVPYPRGQVRNSILVGTDGESIGGNTPDSCRENGELLFIDNAVDQADYGVDVGPFQSDWFVDPDATDFHLAGDGLERFLDIADWDSGDPVVDIDGDARPQSARGFPGCDEP